MFTSLTTLCLAILVLIGVFLLKKIELHRGYRIFLRGPRRYADVLVQHGVAFLISAYRMFWAMITTRRGFMLFVHKIAVIVLYIVRVIERRLVRITALIRGKYGPRHPTEVSSHFLKSVGHHKEHLREFRNHNPHVRG